MPQESTRRDVSRVHYCGSFHPGHDVHFIQARLTWETRRDECRTVSDVADDGTITFGDGGTAWNHDPGRLWRVLARHGREVLVGAYGVLQVPNGRGA
jgi:hypothetical protein